MTPVLDSEGLAEAVLRDREPTTWLAVARAADERVIFSPPTPTTWPCSAVTGDGREGVTASQDVGPGPPRFARMHERASRELVNAIAAGVVRNGLVVTFTVGFGDTAAMSDRVAVIDVHLLLVRGDEVLLSKRRGSYGDGMWHLPAGKLEAGESVAAAAVREAGEEVGVRIAEADLRLAHVVHARGEGVEPRLGLFFEVRRWGGEPANREPDKCYEVAWFRRDRLPDTVIPYALAGVRGYLDGVPFGVFGWQVEIPS